MAVDAHFATTATTGAGVHVPTNPLGRVVDAASRGPESLLRAAGLLPRVAALLDTAEHLLARAGALLSRLEECEAQVQVVIGRVAASERAARAVIDGAADLEQRAEDVTADYEPVVRHILETASYASGRFGPAQVDAVVAYLDFLPMLQAIDRDVVPVLTTLQSVAPELTELLAVSRALNELMGSLPGLGRAKKRVDEELAREKEDDG